MFYLPWQGDYNDVLLSKILNPLNCISQLATIFLQTWAGLGLIPQVPSHIHEDRARHDMRQPRSRSATIRHSAEAAGCAAHWIAPTPLHLHHSCPLSPAIICR
jgi:hypothetical protein